MNTRAFYPEEIIFASTQKCNLHCPHCFVSRSPLQLEVKDAVKFLDSCKNTSIYKIGFSGGEPFLHLDFLLEVIRAAVEREFLFDQIMTNGDWWKTDDELNSHLQKLYEAGYDGKIGLSYDSFHGQSFERIKTFASAVNKIFGEESLNVQTVTDSSLSKEKSDLLEKQLEELAENYAAEVYILPQTFTGKDEKGWQSKKWFKEDYCEGPGQILFVHASGDIAPCCGFANENPALFIGNIKTDTFEAVMKKAEANPMIKLCYKTGLLSCAKQLEKEGKKLPGKGRTDDICTFCDYICKKK
jgi:MoaA/NifB/PqqE/SkfB family radical SAM enzyme